MSGYAVRTAAADVEDRPSRPGLRLVHGGGETQGRHVVSPTEAAMEARRVRRAKRQALLLMVGSAVFSLALLYGLWVLLSRLV